MKGRDKYEGRDRQTVRYMDMKGIDIYEKGGRDGWMARQKDMKDRDGQTDRYERET